LRAPELRDDGSMGGKPCWFTEWGADGATAGCPVDDSVRVVAVREMMSYYDQLAQQGRVAGLFFYNWEGNIHAAKEDQASAFRCGALTVSGRLAVAPMSSAARR